MLREGVWEERSGKGLGRGGEGERKEREGTYLNVRRGKEVRFLLSSGDKCFM